MRNVGILAAVLAGCLTLATASLAAEGADPVLDRIVCRTMAPVVGSRLGGKRQCTTQREWNRIRADSQKLVGDSQTHTFTTSQGQYTGGGY